MKVQVASLFIFTALFMSACGAGSGDNASIGDSEEPYFYEYKTAEYHIDVPNEWEVLNAFPSDYPLETRVAFRNPNKEQDFVANVNIIREYGENTLSNVDLSQLKLKGHEAKLIGYKLISQEEINLALGNDESASLLNTFSGKLETNNERVQFMQSYLNKGDTRWTVTASFSPNEDEFTMERMETMLKSFGLN